MDELSVADSQTEVDPQKLVIGNRYRMEFGDCCVDGVIRGVLAEVDSGDYRATWRFTDAEVNLDGGGSMWEFFEPSDVTGTTS